MASQADIDSIVNLGGITVDQFPPLESDLNYIINDFLPVDYAVVEEVIFNTASTSTATVDISLTASTTFNVSVAAVVDPVAALSSATAFSVSSSSAVASTVEIVANAVFAVDLAANATVDIEIVESAIFNVLTDALADPIVELSEDVLFSIGADALVDPIAGLSSDTSFSVLSISAAESTIEIVEDSIFALDSTASATVDISIVETATFSVATLATIESLVELAEDVAFNVLTDALADPIVELSADTDFLIASISVADPIAELAEDAEFSITGDSDSVVEIDISASSEFDISYDAVATADIGITYAAEFQVDSEGDVETIVELLSSSTFAITSVCNAAVAISLTENVVFNVEHDLEAFSVEPAYLQSNTTFSIETRAVVRNTTYLQGNILDIPVWSWAPNWSSDVTETLQWLTDILVSPTGAEQRRCLRIYPRRQFEYTALSTGRERSYLDEFLTTHGARDMYLPIWHETHLFEDGAPAGSTDIPCSTLSSGEFREGDIIMFKGETAFDFELAEITAIATDSFTIAYPLAKAWPIDTLIHPVRKSRLTDQPQWSRVTDNVITFPVRFQTTEQNNEVLFDPASPIISSLTDTYRSYSVVTSLPEERDALNFSFSRLLEEADSSIAIPVRYDTAGIAFTSQGYAYTTNGRDENRMLRALLYGLRGRATSVWLPTFFEDMVLVADTPAGDTALTIENIRFGALGGPRQNRRDIMIQLMDGTRLYRRILSSSTDDAGNEIIGLDSPFADGLKADDVLSISFMALSRLDQDQVDIVHKTDSAGVSTCALTFKSTPDLRVAGSGF